MANRVYTAADLVKVLRARRLADLGLPLARIDPAVDLDAELALLDAQYARQVEELQERREMIRQLRHDGARADTPAYVQGYIAALNDRNDMPQRSVDTERDAAVMLERFLTQSAQREHELLTSAEIEHLTSATTALLSLTDDSRDAHINAAANQLAAVIERLGGVFASPPLTRESEDSFAHHVNEQLTPVQRDAVHRALRTLPH